MLNHLRTLLLNQDAALAAGADYPGEELVAAGYAAVRPGPTEAAVRRVLFGTAPDRAYLNYRLRQYLGLLHATELAPDALAHDARVTYVDAPNDAALRAAPVVAAAAASAAAAAAALTVTAGPAADDAAGRAYFRYRVEVGPAAVRVDRLVAPVGTDAYPVAFTAGLSGPVVLPDSGVRLAVPDAPGAVWEVTALARPGRAVPAVVAALADLLGSGEALFGRPAVGVYAPWAAVWAGRDEPAYRLAAALLALGERTHEAWAGG